VSVSGLDSNSTFSRSGGVRDPLVSRKSISESINAASKSGTVSSPLCLRLLLGLLLTHCFDDSYRVSVDRAGKFNEFDYVETALT
jgi:hypothetical protein